MIVCPACNHHNQEGAEVSSSAPPPTPIARESAIATGRENLSTFGASPQDGLDNLLPIEPAISLPHRPTPLVSRQPSEDEERAAELFRRIVAEGVPSPQPAPVPMIVQAKVWPRIGRAALYLLVLLAALTPFFTGGQTASWVRPRDSIVAWAQSLDALPAGSAVLVSFDYSPAYGGEMNPLALALARQLAAKSVHMVVMSTKPEGIGLAEQIVALVAQEMPAYRYGESYAILGYLSGQEAGLRTLNESVSSAFRSDHVQRRALEELPVTKDLATLQDVRCVIVLADDNDSVRRWIEQVQSRSNIVLDALVTAGVEPLLVPYYRSGQLRHLMGGAVGAAEYELASHGRPLALRLTDGYAALFVLLVLVALVTNVAEVAAWIRRRRQGR